VSVMNNDNEVTEEYQGGYMRMFREIKKFQNTPQSHSFKRTPFWVMDTIPDESTILDFGCGNGSLGGTGEITYNGKKFWIDGYDLDPGNELAIYHNKDDVKKTYDYIVAFHVLEHMPPMIAFKTLKWFYDHCDAGLFVVVPNIEGNPFYNFWGDTTHVRPLDVPELSYWAEDAGFRVESVIRSRLPDVKPHAKFFRIVASQLLQFSPFMDYTLVCKKDKA
jgi:hypothetical protein